MYYVFKTPECSLLQAENTEQGHLNSDRRQGILDCSLPLPTFEGALVIISYLGASHCGRTTSMESDVLPSAGQRPREQTTFDRRGPRFTPSWVLGNGAASKGKMTRPVVTKRSDAR